MSRLPRTGARPGRPVDREARGERQDQQAGRRPRLTAAGWAIAVATVVAFGLRLFQISRPGHLLGVTEYDDGVYLGAALRLVHGVLPYRDFVLVQPPGLILLMTPVAALAKATGTAWAMAVGRILTAAAGAAAVPLAGRLVRHRGLLAVVIACGLLAVYPDAIAASVTVLQEPWLVLFCLLGALAVFDGDRITGNKRRLILGGLAFGFAGAIKVWAIIPVLVVLALTARQPRRAGAYLAGTAIGFVLPVLPFFAFSPRIFVKGVVVSQLVRVDDVRVPGWTRLASMTGLDGLSPVANTPVLIASIALAVLLAAAFAGAVRVSRRPPPALDLFALVTTVLLVVAFLWPADFYFHYADFLAPFLALSVALPVASLAAARPRRGRRVVAVAAVAALAAMTVAQVFHEARSATSVTPAAAIDRVVPQGACVLTDEVSYTIAANRFFSGRPGCPQIVDGDGTDLALSGGRNGVTGAGQTPAVYAIWNQALRNAQYVWLSSQIGSVEARRIAWTPALRAYFSAHFRPVRGAGAPPNLYKRG